MPTTKDQRDVIVEATESGSSISTFSANFSTVFDTEFGATLGFQEIPQNGVTRDKSRHEIVLLDPTGARLGDLTVKLVTKIKHLDGFSGESAVISTRTDFDPLPARGRVKLNREAAVGFSRVWRQRVLSSAGAPRVAHVARLEAGFQLDDPRTYAIQQAVTTQTDHTLGLTYTLLKDGRPLATGTVTMSTSSAAGNGHDCGPIVIDDDDD